MGMLIKDIAFHLPKQTVTNSELNAAHPDWDMGSVEKKSGVFKRYQAHAEETALDLAVAACKELFAQNPQAREEIDGILFCTQTPDYILPANACLLHGELDLPNDVFATDFNHACSGYVYGLALANGLIEAGTVHNLLLVTAETYSKHINPGDRSTKVLFSDAAAVTLLTSDEGPGSLIDIQCATAGKHHGKFIIPAGGCRLPHSEETRAATTDKNGNVRTPEDIHMDGMGILAFVNSMVPRQVKTMLEQNNLTTEETDLFIFHQASKLAVDSLARCLRLDGDKLFRNIAEIGNTVSSSIPIALKEALEMKRVCSGSTVLLCGFGVGLSWGTALIRIP